MGAAVWDNIAIHHLRSDSACSEIEHLALKFPALFLRPHNLTNSRDLLCAHPNGYARKKEINIPVTWATSLMEVVLIFNSL